MSLFDDADKKKKKAMTTGFKWGRREHRFEMYMTRCLWVNFILVIVYSILVYMEGFESKDYILTALCGIAVLTLVFRLFTEFCHRMEKRNFDPVRFGHKKKSLWRVLFK